MGLPSKIGFFAFAICFLAALFAFSSTAFAASITKEVGVSLEIVASASPPPVLGGGSVPIGYVPFTGQGSVVLKGYAYPFAFVSILRNKALSATAIAQADGTFSVTLTGVPAGLNTFGVFAQDAKGRQSETLNTMIVVFPDFVFTISGLFIPPTIEVPRLVQRNAQIAIEGYVFPESEVSLFFSPDIGVKRATPAQNGAWEYTFLASELREGVYQVRAKAVLDKGEQSEFTSWQPFEIVPFDCRHGDLNGDGEVDMVDLSILLFWWERFHTCPDQNGDGIVDMIDVSILFFWWTK